MIDINAKPSENLPSEDDDDEDEAETLMVAPPSLRERLHSAQRALNLKNQPTIEERQPEEDETKPTANS